MRLRATIAGIAALLALASPGGVIAASRPDVAATELAADVDGRPIKPELISSFYCHDFDFPRIHCFSTSGALAQNIPAPENRDSGKAAAPASTTATDYVTIYDGSNYSGSFMHLSQNYDALFSIGWNDRISSFVGRSNASGTLWTDWFASGTGRNFCCNVQVPTLPAGQDNAFSSVYRH